MTDFSTAPQPTLLRDAAGEATVSATPSRTRDSASFLDRNLSIYLDIVRLLAALAVLVAHLDQAGLHTSWIPLADFSHEAVVVFFVLSGLVISHATFARAGDWRHYLLARSVRIFSVVIPAIILSFLVKWIAVQIDPTSVADEFWERDFTVSNVLGSLFFLNESWSIPTALPWNGAFWSLCYEVWYYVLFGIVLFAPARYRPYALAVSALIAGPSILVLLPTWLLGTFLVRNGTQMLKSRSIGLLLWVLSTALFVWFAQATFDVQLKTYLHDHVPGFWRLEAAQRFITDYFLAILIAINFVAFRSLSGYLGSLSSRLGATMTFLAGFTFSIYLYHQPLTKFAGHFFPNPQHDKFHACVVLVAILGLCMLLGAVTERRRDALRQAFKAFLR